MSSHHPLFRSLTIIVLIVLVLSPLQPVAGAWPLERGEARPSAAAQQPGSGVYRTTVTWRNTVMQRKLADLGVIVLREESAHTAIVLATAGQLEDLARLRFQPVQTDDAVDLVRRQDASKAWLAPVVERLAATLGPEPDKAKTFDKAIEVTVEQRAGLASLNSLDDDGDGLTNTEEAWWCTDPLNPNSDGDAQAYSDDTEVDALLDFTLSRTVRWGYGPPFGPPNAWPNFNDRTGTHVNVCNDGDYDTIPDFAEVFMVGSRVPNETTDGDKFDDGQELFGVTYCPGAPTNCGYGSYPAIEYWNYVKATMPTWVRPPGDNPFVAAFPVPEVSVVPGSWTVDRVTTITTTQGQMTQTTNNYETSVMQGQSTSIADTRTWNNWEEVSESVETPIGTASTNSPIWVQAVLFGAARVLGGAARACLSNVICQGVVGNAVYDVLKSPFNGDENKDTFQLQNTIQNVVVNNVSSSAEAYASVVLNQNFDFQGVVNSLDSVQYAINQQGELLARGLYDINYAISRPRYTETHTNGHSWGGAQTTTHEVYEEHTITQGQAFTTGENWSTAWAVDSSHAADLTFTYTVKNTGTEYARELTGVIFNIYLGDDKTPIISYPAWQQFPNGKLENLFPADAPHQFASNTVPLSLEQMKRIDLGEPLRVVLEDFSYGADELFYQDAVNGGVTVFIEDGVDDGDELVDSYVIPTWGVESVQDVLTRYFPAGYDVDGNLNALQTPEFNGINPPVWHEHFLSDIAWWNIYLTQADAGNTPLKDLPAEAGGAILFRFNRDSDRDGYQDRVELRYGTDKNDPADHPQPEILAGYVKEQSGNVVTVKLVLENSGTFDAYGIDAVMYSPDATTTIGNNTVGGNGKVRPGQHVAVGSLIKPPGLAHWGSSTAKAYSGGNYRGSADRTYTFSAATPGVVGTGSTALNWNDGAGHTGSLPVGGSYHSPLPLSVSDGLEVGLTTGTIAAGASFTVTALTPRDTFTYTFSGANPTPPVIVVSYSDPQGSHRFITPVELPSLDSDLAPYAGQMLQPLGLEIAATGLVDASGTNTTNLIVNSPHPTTIQDAHLYVDIVADGAPVLHQEHTLPTLPPGPTVFPVIWATSAFTQTYDPAADDILLAHWTDSEGNIIDSSARPLNTFAADPTPTLAMAAADATWDFGAVAQGTLLKRSFTMANTGQLDLLTYANAPSGLSLSQTGSRRIAPADQTTYDIVLNTSNLPPGAYDQTVTIRTSDPANSTRAVHVIGTITAGPADTPIGAMQRPLDWPAPVSGTQGQWVEFTHTLGPDPQTLHPVKVYSDNYATFWGVGKYATTFNQGTASYDLFGDGREGDLIIAPNQEVTANPGRAAVAGSTLAGQSVIPVSSSSDFSVGDQVMIIQMQGAEAGKHHFAYVESKTSSSLTVAPSMPFNLMGAYQPTCGGGYWGEYFNNQYLSGSPYAVRCDGQINFDWGEAPPLGTNSGQSKDHVSTRWTSQIVFPTGSYQFTACADDGIRVYLDDVVIIDQWRDQSYTCYYHTRSVSEGMHSLRVEYYENQGGAAVHFILEPVQRAQVVKVRQFRNLTIQSGGRLSAAGWDSHTGGVLAIRVSGSLDIQGEVSVNGRGYRGGQKANSAGWPNNEYYPAMRGENQYEGKDLSRSSDSRGVGGGAGYGDGGGGKGGGGGGGAGGTGSQGGDGGGAGGQVGVTDPALSILLMGGGGGGGGVDTDQGTTDNGANGASGGGIAYIGAREFALAGSILAFGHNGEDPSWVEQGASGGGAGGGGSIKVIAANASVGTNRMNVAGGTGGNGRNGGAPGGNGGIGRIRIEYCESMSGSTNPPASTQKLNCYIAEQIENAPYTTTRLNLPESGSHTYQVQYGRKLNWSGAISQTTTLRVPTGLFTSVTLQALVSDLPSNAWFALDAGNTGSDSWNGTVANAGQYTSPDLAAFFNAYWASHGAPTTGYLDVPVRVTLDRAGQVLLTNLQVTPTGSKVRAVRLAVLPQGYSNVALGFTVSEGSGPLAVGVDVGDNGSIDWTYTGAPAYPASLTTGSLATAVNAYLAGLSGEVDVPLRFILAPFATLNLADFSATPVGQPDAQISAGDIAFSATTPMETEPVTITTTLHNPGTLDSGGLTAAFYATLPNGQPQGLSLQIGSAYVSNIPTNGTTTTSIVWDTTGFTGTVPVRVVVDPYNRVAETNETNNEASANLTILTRPDLQTTQVTLSNPEPVTNETVNVTLSVRNAGQTAAGSQTVALYDGNPEGGGALIAAQGLASLAGGTTTDMVFTWTPATAGEHRLFARLDQDGQVNESDEGNNDTWADVYVGLAGPLLLDSGGANDPPYSPAMGYGYLNGRVSLLCGSQPERSMRVDDDGIVRYRFDHLLPGHFYHLDLTLFECEGVGRHEFIVVDDNLIGGEVDLSNGLVHRFSFLLDPAFYADHTITVAISETTGYNAAITRLDLFDVDYRYADSGRAGDATGRADPMYPTAPPGRAQRSYGWLDGVARSDWGNLPYQSRRVDLTDAEIRYQYDGLDPARHYQLSATFYQQGAGTTAAESVFANDYDTGLSVTVANQQRVDRTVEIPTEAYTNGEPVVMGIRRTNALIGAYINAIALEEITTVPTSACIGDFNNDGFITISDVQAVAVRWNTTCSQPLYDRRYDLDADCDIDILDVQRVAYRWNTQCVTEGSTAPIGQPGYRPPTSPPPPVVVSVETNGAPVVAGTEFTVTVAARDVFNLGGFEFTLAYDPAILQAITATLASFPASGDRPFSAPAPVIDQANGRITFGAFSLGALPGVSGAGDLASVRLRALGSGISDLHLDAAQIANAAGGGLRTETTDAQITVSGCAGDVNGDGEVSVADIQAVSEHWGALSGQPAYASLYDLDGDGDIDVADAQWVAGRFGAQCSSAVKTEVR